MRSKWREYNDPMPEVLPSAPPMLEVLTDLLEEAGQQCRVSRREDWLRVEVGSQAQVIWRINYRTGQWNLYKAYAPTQRMRRVRVPFSSNRRYVVAPAPVYAPRWGLYRVSLKSFIQIYTHHSARSAS